jgi:Protein of unknown function (DUF2845)
MQANRLAFVFIVLLVALGSITAYGFRCSDNLIEVGDFEYKVLKFCGEPMSRDVVGYRINENGDREAKIEHWVYGPKNGRYTILIIEGGVVKKIISQMAD